MALVKCKECGHEVSNKAKACPSCGVEVKRPVKVWQIAVIVVGVLFIVAKLSGPSSTVTATSAVADAITDASNDLLVSDLKSERGEYGNRTIGGTVTNMAATHYKYVQVEINLYDAEGNQVGSTLANVNNLEPRAKWKFSAPILQEKTKSFKVAKITAF